MGIFYEQTTVFNRAPIDLTVRFDGQDMRLVPGLNSIPRLAVQYAKNQNPIMGSQDPENPSISGALFLIGVVNKPGERQIDPIEPLTKEEWEAHKGRPCRMDEQVLFEERYGNDPKARMVVHGRGNTAARSRSDAGAGDKAQLATFDHEKAGAGA